MRPIVTLTMNPALDESTSIDQVVPEHKLRCDAPIFEPGGGGINVSRALSNLGGESLACYLAGGHSGERFQELLDAAEIDQRVVSIAGSTRTSFTVFERSSSLQYRFSMPGPRVEEDEWNVLLDTLATIEPEPDFLVASGSLPPGAPHDLFASIKEVADRSQARLIVDTTGSALQAALDVGLYMIKPNLRELGLLAGRSISNDTVMEQVAKELIAQGRVEVVVVSLGAGGAVLITADETEPIRAPTVPIASKVGAGDSMVAGMVLALATGASISEAVSYGVAAGAAAVMTPGSMLCRKSDTDQLYREILSHRQI